MHAFKSVDTQNLFYFLVQLCSPRNYPPQSAISTHIPLPSPKLFCVIKIRILFLEICNSFSEIGAGGLHSSYFYCKSNSLEKDVICKKKALFFTSAPCKGRAEGLGGAGESLGYERMTSPILVDCRVGLWIPGCSFLLSIHSKVVLFCFVLCFFLIFLDAECPEAKRGNEMGKSALEKFT